MKTTITIFMNPESLMVFLQVLKVVEELPLENDYYFRPDDIDYSETTISNWTRLNIPLDEYLKFKYCYEKNKINN